MNESRPETPPAQTTYLESFSQNTAENIGTINQVHNPTFPNNDMTNEMNPITGITMDTGTNSTFPDDSSRTLPPLYVYKDPTKHFTTVSISPGNCLVRNTFIEITETVHLDLTYQSSYINGDKYPMLEGTRYVYAVVYYNPTRRNPYANVGFLNETSYLTESIQDYCCLLGIVELEVDDRGDIQDIVNDNYIHTIHPVLDISREIAWSWELVDGGSSGIRNILSWPSGLLHYTRNSIFFDGEGVIEDEQETGMFWASDLFEPNLQFYHGRVAYRTNTNVIGGKAYRFTTKVTPNSYYGDSCYIEVVFVPASDFTESMYDTYHYNMGYEWGNIIEKIEQPRGVPYDNLVESTITGTVVVPNNVNEELIVLINFKSRHSYTHITFPDLSFSSMSLVEVT